jgi:hypothetical protein
MSESFLSADRSAPYSEPIESDIGPADFAAELHARYSRSASDDDRRELGQYFTPVKVARLMAELAGSTTSEELRILEPGSGAAVLISNGNTQVSASELRLMPFPRHAQIEAIGRTMNGHEVSVLDSCVDHALDVPAGLSQLIFDNGEKFLGPFAGIPS